MNSTANHQIFKQRAREILDRVPPEMLDDVDRRTQHEQDR